MAIALPFHVSRPFGFRFAPGIPCLSVQVWRSCKPVLVLLTVCMAGASLAGCESTRQRLLAQGYPAPYAIGFEEGCTSGRQAGGALDEFRKNVPAYLDDRQYATGWDDGFRQCQASANRDVEHHVGIASQADRNWQHSKDQAWGRAIRGR